MRDPITVIPWEGAPATTVACGESVTLKPGSNGAPPLPWIVSVRGPEGQTLLHKELPAGARAKQIYVSEFGAELVDAGGSHGAPGTQC
jgi:hypothetical protein